LFEIYHVTEMFVVAKFSIVNATQAICMQIIVTIAYAHFFIPRPITFAKL